MTEGIGNGYGFAPILVGRVEAARLLSISVPELDRLRRNGELVARRKGRRVLLTPAELQRYADTLCLHTNKCSIDVTPAT